uniref:Uncharacterized protein n=1 Tax=Alexandrium monilatum TaxID=311494 RepID=A0A7S4W000_9DINO
MRRHGSASDCGGPIMEVQVNWRWFFASWRGPLVDEVVGAVDRPMWPEVASPDWSWDDEGIEYQPPPYHLSEEGLPWRSGLDAGLLGVGVQKTAVVRGVGKGLGARTLSGMPALDACGPGMGKGQGRGGPGRPLEDEVLDVHLPQDAGEVRFSGGWQPEDCAFEAAD